MKDKIIAKQDEYIKYLLKGILFSNPLRDITKGVRNQFESELSSLKEAEKVSDEKYYCRYCDKSFTDEYELGAHVNSNHNMFSEKQTD